MRRSRPPAPSAPSAFARRFRLLMSYHDLTLREIAAATRNAVSTVGTWRNGRVPSSRAAQEQLAEIFHVSVDYLLSGRHTGAARRERQEEVAGRILDDLELIERELDSHERLRG